MTLWMCNSHNQLGVYVFTLDELLIQVDNYPKVLVVLGLRHQSDLVVGMLIEGHIFNHCFDDSTAHRDKAYGVTCGQNHHLNNCELG